MDASELKYRALQGEPISPMDERQTTSAAVLNLDTVTFFSIGREYESMNTNHVFTEVCLQIVARSVLLYRLLVRIGDMAGGAWAGRKRTHGPQV